MKLSEADFRPKQRSRHVPSAPRRKIPLIRILLLVLAAGLVYKGFDYFWPGAHSAKNAQGVAAQDGGSSAPVWKFSRDSSRALLNCGRSPESVCCESLENLSPGLCGDARAAIQKARWLQRLSLPKATRFEVKFQTVASTREAFLVAVEGYDHARPFGYRRSYQASRMGENPFGSWCDSTGACLTASSPRIPLVQGLFTESTPLEAPSSHWTSRIPEVFPILSGAVSRVDSLGSDRYRIVLYHGKEFYTTYEPLRSLAANLKVGTTVSSHQSIGRAVTDTLAAENQTHTLQLGMEQGGMPLDPDDYFAAEKRIMDAP